MPRVAWELWNEPEGSWLPALNTTAYALLAAAVKRAIHPAAHLVGPASDSGANVPFLNGLFADGALQSFNAITLHPYRKTAPETFLEDLKHLDSLMASYTSQRGIPYEVSEWGYGILPTTSPSGGFGYRMGLKLEPLVY